MIHFEQHLPNWVDGKRDEYDVESLEELLKKEKDVLINDYHKLGWAYGDEETLMVASTTDNFWWVIGYVNGIDLTKHLPYYKSVYKLSGNDIKVVRFLPASEYYPYHTDDLYIVTSEKEDGSYSIQNVDDKYNSLAWVRDGIDVEFVRYATQEEIDKINKYRECG